MQKNCGLKAEVGGEKAANRPRNKLVKKRKKSKLQRGWEDGAR